MQERIFAIAHYADAAVLYLLILLSLISVAMIVERYGRLRRTTKQSKAVQKRIEQALHERDLNVVSEIAKDESSIEGRAAAYALAHLEKNGTRGLEEVFSTISKIERPRLEKSLGFLATVGSNAPYIGLFGTVLGIMKSFQDLANASDAGQGTVMAGISAALIATAAGLMVAIPAVLAYNYFQKQVKTIFASLDSVKEMVLAYGKAKGL